MPRWLTRTREAAGEEAIRQEIAAGEAVAPELELLDMAWGVIANAGWYGTEKSPGWQEAAVRWRDQYHALLDRMER